MLSRKFSVVAVGRAYTDVIAHVTQNFLDFHGIPVNGSLGCSASKLQEICSKVEPLQIIPGGPSANTAATIVSLGGTAGFFGNVHNDDNGLKFLEDFTSRGVALSCSPHHNAFQMSATCLVLLSGENRSIVYNEGCADSFAKDDFNKFDFLSANFFLIEAYLLTESSAKSIIMGAINQAQNRSNIVVNLQGIMSWNMCTEELQYINSKADVIIGNQEEQAAYSCAKNLIRANHKSSQLVITTKGAAGAMVAQDDRVLLEIAASAPNHFVSSVGAGDAFIAGFLLSQSRGLSIKESMSNATQVATCILEEAGGRSARSIVDLISENAHQSILPPTLSPDL